MSFLNTSNQTQSTANAYGGFGTAGSGGVNPNGSTNGQGNSPLSVSQTDSAFADLLKGDDDPQTMLKDMTTGGYQGYWSYQIKQMKQKIAEDTLQSKGLTPQDVANMPADQRADLERQIMREVEQKVRQMTASGKDGKGGLQNAGQTGDGSGQNGFGSQMAANSNQTGARSGVPIAGGDTLQGILATQEMSA
ncbi:MULTISPECIES: hypothetical protein [Nitrospirillum]|uniref:Uncharacterized protein n=1 Tax=Nitrospirillum amazonense TaxID=28077 RepID=A0A560FJ27_9PROT|nr:hypothetical protein [Nitrospirillum amazonense]MEC4594196.1 hypothetical protein [Nitrospirillum amazonense]TWB21596.1 hypothetical protein FBZ88_118114 [Nitrospirillum amazonense]